MNEEEIKKMIREGRNGLKLKAGYGKYITEKRIEKGFTFRQVHEIGGATPFKQSAIELENTKRFSFHDLRITLKALDIKHSEVFHD